MIKLSELDKTRLKWLRNVVMMLQRELKIRKMVGAVVEEENEKTKQLGGHLFNISQLVGLRRGVGGMGIGPVGATIGDADKETAKNTRKIADGIDTGIGIWEAIAIGVEKLRGGVTAVAG